MNPSGLIKRLREYKADISGINDRFCGDAELYRECLEDFLKDPGFAALFISVENDDCQAAFKHAHALKGASGNMGLMPLYDIISEITELTRPYKDVSDASREPEWDFNKRESALRLIADIKTHLERLKDIALDVNVTQGDLNDSDAAGKIGEQTPFDGDTALFANSVEAGENSREARDESPKPHRNVFFDNALTGKISSAVKKAVIGAHGRAGLNEKEISEEKYKTISNSMRSIALTFLAVIIAVGVLFTVLIQNYVDNVERESADHLLEIGNQIKLYMEERFDSNWKTAYSVASSATLRAGNMAAEDALEYMRNEKEIWGLSDICVYTRSGYAIDSSGDVLSNDDASNISYYATAYGDFVTVANGLISYTVHVSTDLSVNGSEIVAISVKSSIVDFIDEMEFSSFDGLGYIYLTDENGKVLSRLSHERVTDTYNIMTIFDSARLTSLDSEHNDDSDILSSPRAGAYMMKNGGNDTYVISVPIKIWRGEARLFFMAPAYAVNENMNTFSTGITLLSIAVITVFSFVILIAFRLVYNMRREQFTTALSRRDRTFDMLVKNSQTAFAHFSIDEPDQMYLSVNAEKLIGGEKLKLVKTDEGYRMRNMQGFDTEVSLMVNKRMSAWDGKGEFHSGYLPRGGKPGNGYFEIMLYPLEDVQGEYVGIAQDVTRQHDREQTVKIALDMARRSDDAKTRFLSNMSHDIRTPMNAIINMTGFAIDSVGSPETQREYLEIIRESSDHLLHLINDILDVSRIESGQTVIDSEPFSVINELNHVLDIVTPLSDAREQTIISDFSMVKTEFVSGDRMKINQVLVNVIGNAVKFTPPGGEIRFTAREVESLDEGLCSLRFTVEDNGIGISEKNLPHIFDAFMRADDGRVNKIEGTGLGLSICQSFISAMGGTIACQSEVDKGSVFTIEIALPKAGDVKKTIPDEDTITDGGTFEGKRCLVCEDNHTNQIIAKTILERLGFTVELADDGRKGFEKFVSSKGDYYDIIYMDIRMPVMDGYQAVTAIRASSHPRAKSVPIIAMTANVFAEDVEKSRVFGMNGHLGKPITVSRLVEQTRNALNNERSQIS